MIRILVPLLWVFAGAAAAQEDGGSFGFGGDVFVAGSDAVFDGQAADDLFMAGGRVEMLAPAGGSVHMAGRRLLAAAETGQDFYAAGMDVVLTGPVRGDATVAGYDLRLGGEVGGDLRAAGSSVTLEAPVAGYALLAGEVVRLDARISGDASITGSEIAFGDAARVDGTLTIAHERPESVQVPAAVAPPERVVIRQLAESDFEVPSFAPDLVPVGWRSVASGLIGSVVVTGLVATLLAAVAPEMLAGMRRLALARPFWTLWLGFLTLSLLVGATLVLAITLVGILVSPAALILAGGVGFLGYVIGVYIFGVGVLGAFGRHEPHDIRDRALAAFTGAAITALVALVPVLGWLFAVALALLGAGALARRTLRPGFFVDQSA